MKLRIPAKVSRSGAKKELYRGRKAKRLHLFISEVEASHREHGKHLFRAADILRV